MSNEHGDKDPNLEEDNTSEINELLESDELSEDMKKKIQTLTAQKQHFREKAIDPETGKPYKDLYTQSLQEGDKTPENEQEPSKKDDSQDVKKTVQQILDEQYLEDQDLPDPIKEKAKKLAKVEGIPIRQALKDDFIVAQVEEHQRQERASSGAADGSSRSVSSQSTEAPLDPANFDLSTEEGRKAWDEAKAARAK